MNKIRGKMNTGSFDPLYSLETSNCPLPRPAAYTQDK